MRERKSVNNDRRKSANDKTKKICEERQEGNLRKITRMENLIMRKIIPWLP
jgi:hypothetical protein